ncbi:12513_t:CDS:2 [Entrophospora sp. SA101]|nr:12513_t:CDS:2 [Entrophospora sp. SA101]
MYGREVEDTEFNMKSTYVIWKFDYRLSKLVIDSLLPKLQFEHLMSLSEMDDSTTTCLIQSRS